MSSLSERKLPLALKIGFTVFMLAWVPIYWQQYGPANFLWLCDLANFLILLGLWLESPLVISTQSAGVLLVQCAWSLDFLGRLLFGFHPIGGTQYMFSEQYPLWLRLLSLFHLIIPVLLLFALGRLGYDRRAAWLQSALMWLVLPLCFFFTDPERNLNWLWRPFERTQTLMPPLAFLAVMMALYPLVLFWPTHLALRRFFPDPRPSETAC